MAGGWLHSARPRRHPGMMYYGKDAIMDVRGIGLLDYLQRYEPDNLRRVSPGVFCTKEHDSLRISNGKWYWFSRLRICRSRQLWSGFMERRQVCRLFLRPEIMSAS